MTHAQQWLTRRMVPRRWRGQPRVCRPMKTSGLARAGRLFTDGEPLGEVPTGAENVGSRESRRAGHSAHAVHLLTDGEPSNQAGCVPRSIVYVVTGGVTPPAKAGAVHFSTRRACPAHATGYGSWRYF